VKNRLQNDEKVGGFKLLVLQALYHIQQDNSTVKRGGNERKLTKLQLFFAG